MNEPQRFRRQDVSPKGAVSDPLNMLPNLKDYEKPSYALNSDNYSTMGALVVGVSDLPSLNASRGFEYGQELLTYVLEVLTGIFDRRYIYRIWDSEFAVLLPDTIQDVFNARCLRLKTRLSRRYPGLIKTGYTWSDGIFNARALIKEAKNLMKCDTLPSPESSSQFWREISVPVSIKRYIPYYQPKVDMRSGSLIGAEAVVRGLGDDGNIIMPGEFIEALEKNGGIRELDFFMMENVMRQLKQWQEKGYALPKTSVNISRRTLFHPTTLASVLAIQSRYPELPQGQLDEYVGREFQLMDHDVGRSIQIFAHSFPSEDIVNDAQQVLKNLVPIDREVTSMNGSCYTLRIAPYRTTENSIRGLVITIIDSLGAKK